MHGRLTIALLAPAMLAVLLLGACGQPATPVPIDEPADASAEEAGDEPEGEGALAPGQEPAEELLGIIDTPNPDGQLVLPRPGGLAPNFRLETLKGNTLVFSDLRGKPVLLNFFAVWCGPCRYEMPMLEEVHQSHKDQLTIVAVDLNEPRERVEVYTDTLGLTFTIVLDKGNKVAAGYQMPALPASYLIDKDGIVQGIHLGAFYSTEDILTRLQVVGIEG